MQNVPSLQNHIRLLHNIDFTNQKADTTDLVKLMLESDAQLGGINILKNESASAVASNVEKNLPAFETFQNAEVSENKKFRVFRRETPFRSARITGSTPGWANGAAPAFSLGPFTSFDGRNFWFDFFRYTKLVSVFYGTDPIPIIMLSLKVPLLPLAHSNFDVATGSAWIRADLLAPGLSNTQYTGFKVSGGNISISKSHVIEADKLVIVGTETFSVKFNLDNTYNNTGTSQFGIDARQSKVTMPDSIQFNFAAHKFSVKAVFASSWTVYGDERNFKWTGNSAITYEKYLQRIFIPFETIQKHFEIENCASGFFNVAGGAPVLTAGWLLSVSTMDVSKPFDVKGNGALTLVCGEGLSGRWKGLEVAAPRVQYKLPIIMAEPGKISLTDLIPSFQSLTETYKLWKRNTDEKNHIRTSVELFFRNNKAFNYYSDETGFEAITTLADCTFLIDKPFRADGSSVSPQSIDTFYLKYISDEGTTVTLYDADVILEMNLGFKHLKKPEIYQFSIANAFITTTPPASLFLSGAVNTNNIFTKAQLNIAYGLFNLTPTLPHPYTSNRSGQFGTDANILKDIKDVTQWFPLFENYLMSKCSWEEGVIETQGTVKVDFELLTDLFKQLNKLPTGTSVDQQVISTITNEDLTEKFSLMDGITNNDIYGRMMYSLLDVSTNYDLFGINMVWYNRSFTKLSRSTVSIVSENVVKIDDMHLQAPMQLLSGFTLPHISWEPVNNLTAPTVSGDPPEGILSFPDNGPPTIFSQLDLTRVAIDPLAFLKRFRANIASEGKTIPFSYIIFGLPNGKVSLAFVNRFSEEFGSVVHNNSFIQPEFTTGKSVVKGGLQYRLTASKEDARDQLQGLTNQLVNLTDSKGISINKSVLGVTVHEIFQNEFYLNTITSKPEVKPDGVPLTHIDFSGYGASMFSDWKFPAASIGQVSKVRFDVSVGRLSHEVVQVVSILYPWGIKVIRTITFHRNNNAIIYREDSGWIAQSDGTFDFSFSGETTMVKLKPFDNPFSIHPGLINGLFNIRNIKELEEPEVQIEYTLQAGDMDFVNKKIVENPALGVKRPAKLRAVTFDANVNIDGLSGGATNNMAAGKSFKGYLQILPQGIPIPARVLKDLLLRQQNSIGGTIDSIVKLGGSNQTIKANRVDVSASYQKNNLSDIIFVAAIKGSVQLPAEGSWSVVEVDKKSGEVLPVTNKLSVPVIRLGERDRKAAFKVHNDGVAKVAFADALLNNEASFAKRYGYVQNTSTQKVLYTDPRYDVKKLNQLITEPVLLADAYRLLNSKGPFPNLVNAIPIEIGSQSITSIIPTGLVKKVTGFSVPNSKLKFDIVGTDKDVLHMYIQYATKGSNSVIEYATDSASAGDKWKNEVNNMSIVVDMGPFKELMTISGNFKNKNSITPGFETGNAPQLKLCKELQPIYDILDFLDKLNPDNPVEAVKKGLQIAMSNSAESWEYKFKAEKEIPLVRFPFDTILYNNPTTVFKMEAHFKIGCYFNEPIQIPNTKDDLIPSAGAFLELGATIRVMVFSLGAASIFAAGRAEVGLAADIKSGPNLYFKFGFGVELAVGLPVIGDVAVMYMVGVDMKLTTKELTIGAFLYFRGRAEIFAGIVTVTIQIEAAGKITKSLVGGPTNCIAVCTFALDISIFLVIDISFSETWEETRQIA